MLTFDLHFDEDEARASFAHYVDGSLPAALCDAVNAVAHDARRRLQHEVLAAFPSPVEFTQQAFGMFPAEPRDDGGDPSALVFVYDTQAQYLGFQVFGGNRVAGDYATVPGGSLVPLRDAPTDSHGNLPREFLAETAGQRGVNWVRFGGAGNEVLVRHGLDGTLEFLAEVMPDIDYAPKFDFYGVVGQVVSAELPGAVADAIAQA